MNRTVTNILAGCLLLLMFGLAFFSILGDANTMDELAHTPSGYSYIVKQDMRLNPEHPPLLKDLAGLSVLIGSKITGTTINFPDQKESWTEAINGQWDFGRELLFRNQNDADKIIFFARLPMILIMLILGFYVFKWGRELYGDKAGLIALFLYSLSPTFIAHGRLVTTDVGAAAAFFIATYYLVKWLQKPDKKNLVIAGLVFGLALLTKFSLVLLIPYFVLITLIWAIVNKNWKLILGLALIGIIAMALVYPVYLFHTWNYPFEKQIADAEHNLATYGNKLFSEPTLWMNTQTILRPYGQFFTGLLMVIQRVAGGNTTYFLGEISNVAWSLYFPIVFLIKVPLALLILILISLGIAIIKRHEINSYLVEISLLIFLAIYWYTSITSNLNIGIRHILPTFPIIYILISGQISKWLCLPPGPFLEKIKLTPKKLFISVKMTFKEYFKLYLKYLILIILLAWYGFSVIGIYPHFLTYFNELVGGPTQGYKYVTDSNLDWGQDLKRLAQYIKDNEIETIYVDYFGGDDLEYRLGNRYQAWWKDRLPNELPPDSWLAISASFLQGGRGITTKGYQEKTDSYNWLNQYEPVTIIGNSIFIYNIK